MRKSQWKGDLGRWEVKKEQTEKTGEEGGVADYVVQLQDNNKVTVNDQRTIEL